MMESHSVQNNAQDCRIKMCTTSGPWTVKCIPTVIKLVVRLKIYGIIADMVPYNTMNDFL